MFDCDGTLVDSQANIVRAMQESFARLDLAPPPPHAVRRVVGLSLLEAMQAGLPIIASRTEGALHLADTMNPELVPIDDMTALAQALQRVDQARPGRRQYKLNRFSIHSKLAQLDSFYRRELKQLASPAMLAVQPKPDAP